MASALDLIKRSMRLMRVLGATEDPVDAIADACLARLNSMLDGWALERLMVYQTKQENFTWPSATVSRTIGSSGNFNTTRPIDIEGGFTRDAAGNDYPFTVIDSDAYDAIRLKTLGTYYPDYLFYDTGFPLGTIYLYGVPSTSLTIFLNSRLQFTQAASLSTTLSLPPGYQRAIEYNLAPEIAPMFNQPVAPEIARIAVESKRAIKNVNARTMVSQLDPGISGSRRSNILTG